MNSIEVARQAFRNEGAQARREGKMIAHCPYHPHIGSRPPVVSEGQEWINGWREQDRKEREQP